MGRGEAPLTAMAFGNAPPPLLGAESLRVAPRRAGLQPRDASAARAASHRGFLRVMLSVDVLESAAKGSALDYPTCFGTVLGGKMLKFSLLPCKIIFCRLPGAQEGTSVPRGRDAQSVERQVDPGSAAARNLWVLPLPAPLPLLPEP